MLLAGDVGTLYRMGANAFLMNYLARFEVCGLNAANYNERMRAVKVDEIGQPVAGARLQIVLLVPIDDLAAGREPDLLPRRDVRQRLGEILAPVRVADQERMQADRHHPAGLGAVLVEHIELVADHLAEPLRALVQAEQRRNVVDLRRIGHRDHRALLHLHRIGLLVVHPVADVFDAVLGKDIERAHGLAQRRAEPAARRLADALGDGRHRFLDQRALLGLRLLVDQDGIGDAVPHPFPAELLALLDDARIFAANVGVERHRAAHAVPLP